jgi:hypothetical protein
MNCGIVRPADLARLLELHIGHIVFHTGAYLQSGRANAWFAWQALQDAGYRAQAGGGRVWLYPVGARTPGAARQPAPVREPDRAAPVLCEGWRGWRMKERDAPLWLYGEQNVEIELTSPAPTFGYVYVDGGTPTRFEVEETVTLAVELDGARWHSIVIEIPALFPTKPPQGFEIVRLTYR